jgi:hypothetical protein
MGLGQRCRLRSRLDETTQLKHISVCLAPAFGLAPIQLGQLGFEQQHQHPGGAFREAENRSGHTFITSRKWLHQRVYLYVDQALVVRHGLDFLKLDGVGFHAKFESYGVRTDAKVLRALLKHLAVALWRNP